MSNKQSAKSSKNTTYESPKVTEESLSEGGNYVSPAFADDGDSEGYVSPGTLGNSPIV